MRLESRIELTHDLEKLEALRTELQAAAKDDGLYLPQLLEELGGLGLDWRRIGSGLARGKKAGL